MAVYDALAETYQHGMARVTALHARDIAAALELRPGDRALDVAAGTGAVTAPLAELVGAGGLVVAADVALGMLDIARRRLSGDFPQVHYALASAESLPATGVFDGVSCGFGIQHMEDPDAALRSMRAALKPGGRCAVAVCGEVGRDIKTPISEAFAAVSPTRHLSPTQATWSTAGMLAGKLSAAGFRSVDECLSTGFLQVRDIDEWWEVVTSGGTGNRLRVIGAEQAARVREESYRRVERFATRDGAGWTFPSAAILVTGVVL